MNERFHIEGKFFQYLDLRIPDSFLYAPESYFQQGAYLSILTTQSTAIKHLYGDIDSEVPLYTFLLALTVERVQLELVEQHAGRIQKT